MHFSVEFAAVYNQAKLLTPIFEDFSVHKKVQISSKQHKMRRILRITFTPTTLQE